MTMLPSIFLWPIVLRQWRWHFWTLHPGKQSICQERGIRRGTPIRKKCYFANVHIGAVPSVGIPCVRAGSQIIIPPSENNKRRFCENPLPYNWGFVIFCNSHSRSDYWRIVPVYSEPYEPIKLSKHSYGLYKEGMKAQRLIIDILA